MSERPATLYELCESLISICKWHPELRDKEVSVKTECGYSGANIAYPVRVYKHGKFKNVSILTDDDANVEEEEGYTVYNAGEKKTVLKRKQPTNRERYILDVNEYDMLMMMQTNLIKCCRCVLDVITGTTVLCPTEAHGKVGDQSRLAVCGECIQKWLNEEG